jgi:hypothetical protein
MSTRSSSPNTMGANARASATQIPATFLLRHRLRYRAIGIGALALGVLALGSTPALAAQRYAAPTPAGTKDCSSVANACSLSTAVGSAAKGDEVIVEPGSYGTAATPLGSPISSGAEDLDIHGTDSSPGKPSATVYTQESYGIEIYGTGSTIRDLEVVDSGTSDGGSLLLEGATGEQLVLRAGTNEHYTCVLALTAILRDSVCENEGDGVAADVSGTIDGPNNVTLRNVTAVSTDGVGIYAASNPFKERSVKLTVLNTIARGGEYDILGEAFTEPSTVITSHSNYRAASIKVTDGATLADDGTSKTTGNQGLTELFVSPTTNDFRELLGAQTIGAGLIEPANGVFDFEGNARVFAGGTGCASTDVGADQFDPASGPTVTAATASAVGQTVATLSGTANPLGGTGTAHFDFAPAATGGGPPASFSATATQCLPVTNAARPVTTTLTGLTPGTTYYYRLVSTNGNATTTPAFTATFTTTAGGSSPPPVTSPILTNLSQTAKTWREGKLPVRISSRRKDGKKALPIGTTFSFELNEPASATFTFTKSTGGRRVGKTCVAETKKNKHKRRCTRAVPVTTLTFSAHAGTNKLSFDGVISAHKKLPPGNYTLLATATTSGRHSATGTLHFTIAG